MQLLAFARKCCFLGASGPVVESVATTVGVRLGFTPASSTLRPVRFAWGWGLYASGFIALATMAIAATFGGRVDDVPTKRARRGDETLH